jgi:hypothetical protein
VDKEVIMRSLKFATFALLGMTSVVSLAQAQSMDSSTTTVRSSEPYSTRASNIVANDTRSTIAPALPTPAVGDNAAAPDYVRAARDSLTAGKTGEAQQSLEMAETRELTRESTPDAAGMQDGNPRVIRIRDALHALGEGDRGRAIEIIDAMAD